LRIAPIAIPSISSCSTCTCLRWTARRSAERIRADARFAGLPLVLLSSVGGMREMQDLCFNATLPKPVRQATLLRTLLVVLGEQSEEPADRPRAIEPLSERLHVLLAEDNPVNQMVGVRMLKRLGERRRGGRHGRGRRPRARPEVLRHRADGRADAGHGRPRGHDRDPTPRGAVDRASRSSP
jgi:CheY-like chemotaxis protein